MSCISFNARSFVAAMIIALFAAPLFAQLPGTTYTWSFSNPQRTSKIWIPQDLETIRGILIIGNTGGGSVLDQATQQIHQRFAKQFGFAVLATGLWSNFSVPEEMDLWEYQLQQVADATGHPEIVHAPWAPIGYSNGGMMSYGFNALRPEKTIGVILDKAGIVNVALPSDAALATPGMFVGGEFDVGNNPAIKTAFDNNRPRGANWAWTEQEGVGHESYALGIVYPFMAQAIRARYPMDQIPTATSGVTLRPIDPDKAWLADNATWPTGLTSISKIDDYEGDPSTASWLQNKHVARVYRAFASHDQFFAMSTTVGTDVFFSETADPLTARVRIHSLDNFPGWTKVELFANAHVIAEFSPTDILPNPFVIYAPVPRPGVWGIYATVTLPDGSIRTTRPKAFIAAPEPVSLALLVPGALLLLRRRRAR